MRYYSKVSQIEKKLLCSSSQAQKIFSKSKKTAEELNIKYWRNLVPNKAINSYLGQEIFEQPK